MKSIDLPAGLLCRSGLHEWKQLCTIVFLLVRFHHNFHCLLLAPHAHLLVSIRRTLDLTTRFRWPPHSGATRMSSKLCISYLSISVASFRQHALTAIHPSICPGGAGPMYPSSAVSLSPFLVNDEQPAIFERSVAMAILKPFC